MLRLGWFKPVHVEAASARERRMLLAARDTLDAQIHDANGDCTMRPSDNGLERYQQFMDTRSGIDRRSHLESG